MNSSKTGCRASVDLIHGPIMPSLLTFMFPVFISNVFQQLYNAADTAIVGNFLGENSLAAIGACASIFELLTVFANNMGNGFAMVTARAFGAGNERNLRRSVAGSILIGAAAVAVLTIASVLGLRPLLKLINTPNAILDEAYSYIRIVGEWLAVTFLYNLCAGLLRAIGNSVMPLVFLIFSSVLNVVLDIFMITSLHMGVAGAAYATVIAQAVSAVLCVLYIFRRARILIPRVEDFRHIGRFMLADLAGQGFSMAFMGSIVSIGSIILQFGINGLGEAVIAGHVAARKIFSIGNLLFMSMASAMATFVSQNRGADKRDRILTAMRKARWFDLLSMLIVAFLFYFTATPLMRLISGSDNPVILGNGTAYLRFTAPFYFVLGMLLQTRFALQGLGAKLVPLISSGIELMGKILFTWLLVPRFGYPAVIACEPVIWLFMTAQLLYAFYKDPYIRGKE